MDKPENAALLLQLTETRFFYVSVHDGYDFADFEWDGPTLTTYQCRTDGTREWQGSFPGVLAVGQVNPNLDDFKDLHTGDIVEIEGQIPGLH